MNYLKLPRQNYQDGLTGKDVSQKTSPARLQYSAHKCRKERNKYFIPKETEFVGYINLTKLESFVSRKDQMGKILP